MSGEALLLVNAAATWAMVGLIWFVQLVHYPLFARVGPEGFVAYEAAHKTRTGLVVALFGPLEVLTALALVVRRPAATDPGLVLGAAALAVLVWLVTIAVQVPLHGRLSTGFDPDDVRRLVRTNALRTLIWTGRGALVLVLLGQVLAG